MPELDTLRGFAVSLVVCYHAFGFGYGLSGLSGIPKFLVSLTMAGWTGVNLFFVLSGFLITGILLDTKERPDYYRRFYIRRALRILPLYYAVLLLLLVLTRLHWVPRNARWSFLALSAIYLANVTELFHVPMQYGVLWSLGVEEHFYLVWPTILRPLSRRNLMICAVAVAGACLGLRSFYFLHGYIIGGYIWLRADGLAIGALLACVIRSPVNARNAVRNLSGLAITASLLLLAAGAPFGILHAAHFLGQTLRETCLDFFCMGVIGLTLLVGTSSWKIAVNRSVFQFLGKISYGVYLMHMLVFEVVAGFTHRWWPRFDAAPGRFGAITLQFCVAGTLTIVLAWFSRKFFEEFFLKMKDRRVDERWVQLAEISETKAEHFLTAVS